MPWNEAINQAGAKQMQHGKRLIESRPFFDRIPDESIIISDRVSTSVPVPAGIVSWQHVIPLEHILWFMLDRQEVQHRYFKYQGQEVAQLVVRSTHGRSTIDR